MIVGKRCSKCEEFKLFSEFYRYFNHGKWRYRSRCKACMIAETKSRNKKP